MLEKMGLQRVGRDWVTELNWTELWFPSCDSAEIISFASQYLRSFVNRKHNGRWSFLLPHAPDHTTPARVPYWGKSCWFPKQQFCWYFFSTPEPDSPPEKRCPSWPNPPEKTESQTYGSLSSDPQSSVWVKWCPVLRDQQSTAEFLHWSLISAIKAILLIDSGFSL